MSQVRFHFNDARTAQAAAHLLRLNGGTMPYMVLIKLLYLADRKMLLDHGRPITGDALFSMKHGPVLSTVLDFIQHGPKREPHTVWFSLISEPKGYDVSLRTDDPPNEELSPLELTLLQEIHEEFGKFDRWDLVDVLHRILPEWKDPGGSATRIDHEDILRAANRSDDEIEMIASEATSARFLTSLGR